MKILVSDRIAPEGIQRLRAYGHEVVVEMNLSADSLVEALADCQGLVVRSRTRVTEALMRACPSLLVVGRAGVGCDNIDLPACERLGVAVFNTPGASAITTAERTFALMMAMLHQITTAERSVRAGHWDRRSFLGNELFQKTLGIIGYGNVGRVVGNRARAFQMNVLASDPYIPSTSMLHLGIVRVSLDELLRESDIVTCHLPADPAYARFIGAREIALMKPGSWLINTSRGFVVEETALVSALEHGHLRGAALDVFENEPLAHDSRLREFENVVLSPHLGASTREAEMRVGLAVAENMAMYLAEGRADDLRAKPTTPRHVAAAAPMSHSK